jgi:heme-degrading monooxygenase HmoA
VSVYTLGVWRVKAGREDEFVARWRSLAQWTLDEEIHGASHATLVRDHEDPRRFISFGPWGSAEAVERWRAHPGFEERFAKIQETLESFEPGLYEPVLLIS